MNQQIINYLKTNKQQYTKKTLIEQLRQKGYGEAEILDAISVVFEKETINVSYAGFWIRFIATIIDTIVLVIIMAPFVFVFRLIITTNFFWSMILMPLSIFVVSLIYYVFMTDKYQATLGKKLFHLKVVDEYTLQQTTLANIINRELVSRVVFFIFMPIHIFVAFMKKKQGIHDMSAETVVIYAKK